MRAKLATERGDPNVSENLAVKFMLELARISRSYMELSTNSVDRSWRSGTGRDIVTFVVMATSVHLPSKLLEAVDRKAKALRISRNQLVVQALEREVQDAEWSVGFFERLADTNSETSSAVDDMMREIRKTRRSKPARRF